MPALRPVFGVCRISFRGTSQGQAVVNVFHVETASGIVTAGQAPALLTAVRTAYQTNLVPLMNGNWSGDTATLQDLSSNTGVNLQQALAGSPGSTSSNIPQSAACCITWKINRYYRGGHPRTYIGPLHSAAIESPTSLAAAYVTSAQNAANNFLSAVNAILVGGLGTYLCTVHRQENGAQLTTPVVSRIQSAVVDTRIDTMRRRLGRDR